MSRKHPRLTEHHRLPRSRGGANHYPNTKRIPDTKHRAIHTLFENQTFLEKIETLLRMDMDVLTQEVRDKVMEILEFDPDDVYVKDAFKIYNHGQ